MQFFDMDPTSLHVHEARKHKKPVNVKIDAFIIWLVAVGIWLAV